MRTSRRSLLALASLVPFTFIAGCAVSSTSQLQTVVSDINLIATSLNAALPAFAAISGITPTALAKVQSAVADLVAVASAAGTADTATQMQPLVQRVESDVNSVVSALAGLPLPPQLSVPIEAASVLLPVIEAAVGVVVTSTTNSTMTAAQARAVLQSH